MTHHPAETLRGVERFLYARIYGHHFFNRPGPRLVESLKILAELLHPGAVEPHHRGQAWMPL